MKYFAAALIVAGLGLFPVSGLAQVAPPNSSPSNTESGPASALKKDILTLVQAKVGDPVIIAYIRKNATPGNRLSSQDVIELKQAGASDAILAALVEATATAGSTTPSSGSSGGPTTYVYPDNSTTYVYSSPDYPYGTYYDSYWPYYYYSYPYGYPYWGFGVSVPFFFRDHDGRFHRFDHFHDGRFRRFDGFHDRNFRRFDHFQGGHFSHFNQFHGGHFGAMAALHGGFGGHVGFGSHGGAGHGGGHR